MDPRPVSSAASPGGLPRTRGDGPAAEHGFKRRNVASPHTRGWTLYPGGAGMNDRGFPAHAGMDPARELARSPINTVAIAFTDVQA